MIVVPALNYSRLVRRVAFAAVQQNYSLPLRYGLVTFLFRLLSEVTRPFFLRQRMILHRLFHHCVYLLIGLLSSHLLLAQTSTIPPAPILSRWEKQVTPENAWREYPRPQLVRSQWQNLNGLWEYAIRPKTAPQPTQFDGQILVPFCVE